MAGHHQHSVLKWLKSLSAEEMVAKRDVAEPLAVWRGLNKERHFIEQHFKEYDTDCSNTLHQDQLVRILTDLNDGKPPRPEEVQWVLAFAAQTSAEGVGCLSDAATSQPSVSTQGSEESKGATEEMLQEMKRAIGEAQELLKRGDLSGAEAATLRAERLRSALKSRVPPTADRQSSAQTARSWIPTDKPVRDEDWERTGSISIDVTIGQLSAALALWFHHVSPLHVRPKVGWLKVVPYVYSGVAAIASCVVVAATTVLFSEEKTIEWLVAVLLSQVWKAFVIEPLKAIMFGRSFECLFGLLLGDCAMEEVALDMMQDNMEGSTEGFGEDLTAALGVEEAMEDMATNGDEVGDMATTMALDAGRDDSGGQDEESKVLPRP